MKMENSATVRHCRFMNFHLNLDEARLSSTSIGINSRSIRDMFSGVAFFLLKKRSASRRRAVETPSNMSRTVVGTLHTFRLQHARAIAFRVNKPGIESNARNVIRCAHTLHAA